MLNKLKKQYIAGITLTESGCQGLACRVLVKTLSWSAVSLSPLEVLVQASERFQQTQSQAAEPLTSPFHCLMPAARAWLEGLKGGQLAGLPPGLCHYSVAQQAGNKHPAPWQQLYACQFTPTLSHRQLSQVSIDPVLKGMWCAAGGLRTAYPV